MISEFKNIPSNFKTMLAIPEHWSIKVVRILLYIALLAVIIPLGIVSDVLQWILRPLEEMLIFALKFFVIVFSVGILIQQIANYFYVDAGKLNKGSGG